MLTRSLAGLFTCCLLGACGSGGSNSASNTTPPPPPSATNLSMRFFGTGAGIDRVKIGVAAGGTSRPVNVGATDFTIEFFIKGALASNPSPACVTGLQAKDAWLNGVVVLDRDVLGDGDFGDFGIALFNGQIMVGVSRGAGGASLCASANVLDGAWHHVAVTRQRATGQMKVFVDGAQEAAISDPAAGLDVSYNPLHANPDANDAFLVLGAQKRDAVTARAFNGLIDELRISIVRRYDGTYVKPTTAFQLDANTAALYHFDEASGTDVVDAANTNASPGVLIPSGAGASTHHSTDVPF